MERDKTFKAWRYLKVHLGQQHHMTPDGIKDMVKATKNSYKSNPLNTDKTLPAQLSEMELTYVDVGPTWKVFTCKLCEDENLPAVVRKEEAETHLSQHGVNCDGFVVVRDGRLLAKCTLSNKKKCATMMAFETYFLKDDSSGAH